LFPFQANGRALPGREVGFVRVTARADNHLLLGIAAVGAGCRNSAAFASLEMGARLEDVGGTIHAHRPGRAHEASLRALAKRFI
jgi:dihydrolipoamide dehydrogenase